MAKTQEELNTLKQEYESLTTKLEELTEDELKQVCAGGFIWDIAVKQKEKFNILKNTHGKTNKLTSLRFDETSAELIISSKDYR